MNNLHECDFTGLRLQVENLGLHRCYIHSSPCEPISLKFRVWGFRGLPVDRLDCIRAVDGFGGTSDISQPYCGELWLASFRTKREENAILALRPGQHLEMIQEGIERYLVMVVKVERSALSEVVMLIIGGGLLM